MKMRYRKSGFTMVELLVVVLIITILSTIVGVRLFREPDKAKIAAARAQISNFKVALGVYRTEQGRFPTQEQGLQALVARPTIAPVPKEYPDADGYLEALVLPLDPWKNDYVYLSPGSHGEKYEIICYGSDGEEGGEGPAADISSSLP